MNYQAIYTFLAFAFFALAVITHVANEDYEIDHRMYNPKLLWVDIVLVALVLIFGSLAAGKS